MNITNTTGSLEDLFIANKDTDTHRVCGTCGELKLVKDFYKDGKTNAGTPKYRRDCKECYKRTRLQEDAFKQRKEHKQDGTSTNSSPVHK